VHYYKFTYHKMSKGEIQVWDPPEAQRISILDRFSPELSSKPIWEG